MPWEALRAYLEAPASSVRTSSRPESEIEAIERRYNVRLPLEYRDFLIHAAPVQDNDMDNDLGSWWTPERVKSILDEGVHSNYPPDVAAEAETALFFLDHLGWCWAWAICCGDGPNHGRVILINSKDRFVADSFGEFVNRYINDWASLN
ncbi:hypothetical protein DBR17_08945 [Sphingomonas sp. HMWF008]|nr:hypothetical protein DBR17_08945 [Sphingomonas sp. HMWF008]